MRPIERLTKQAGSCGRIEALNLKNTRDEGGIVRGSILPVGTPQPRLNYVIAVVTLSAFVSWPYFVAVLCVSSAILLAEDKASCFQRGNRHASSYVTSASPKSGHATGMT